MKKKKKVNFSKYFSNTNFYESFKLVSACNSGTEFDKDGNETSNFKTDLAFTKVLKEFDEDIVELRNKYILPINKKYPRIPFSSKRKKMSTIITTHDFPKKYRLLIKGGADIILPCCTHYHEGDTIVEINKLKQEELEKKIKEFTKLTLRTIVIAYKDIPETEINNWDQTETRFDGLENRDFHTIEESKLILIAIVGIKDMLKDKVKEAVIDLKHAQINVIMVTGDNIDTAVAIAKSCNIMESDDKSEAIDGTSFNLRCGGVVCENCFDKDAYMEALKKQKRISQNLNTIL